ncbi:DNA adenine methylase [Clostridium sp. HV4-5-A1G]|uniref:DNA adenine methylase n=1 Tax=Clostridium sp. HV4-5-A1G TaxID=2004595 RepID=UPI00123BF227|nr:DNA adenine methylase [Clostridium sp. HV4-5-A1G]KAA8668355.1 DNA adenine methylase [Clostridium sp. HV4-5-A1G]
MKQVLKYPGSKWSIAGWIIKNFPEHHSYVEPFFGSGAVFFSKVPSSIETINDLDDDVINLFTCIRDNSKELVRKIAMTPYSRKEYDESFKIEALNKVDKALNFLIKCWQGHGFRTNGYKVGWKNDVQGRENMYAVYNWYRLPEWVIGIVDRLKQVQIENRPALEVIERFNYPNVLIYADPPYLLDTRKAKQYKYEMTEQDHIELLEILLQHKGKIILSGYQSDLYDKMLKGWHKKSVKGQAEYYGADREEVIWTNFEPPIEQLSLVI